ncbi:hypothetical protein HaLaN_25491 [Haematococcus lacustris]|uniref:F-box domain-containing protein n=1 Tax=Haematococcus lacustris TaxID=44745 RepID=A0A6A0A414_HAELA|nr:hypothetical protein HaLaN_25491 [Haematococcus lacustris]
MPPSLSEITPDLASLVASQLELDERAVGRLAITSKFWWTVCADQQLWRTLAARRFGLKAVQPGQCPPELQGWTFLPGLDLAETRALPCLVKDFRSLADLAHHCLNKHEVVAFTTKGHVAELPAVQW